MRGSLTRLCTAVFVAYCSYAICRTPLLPLFASELGASPSVVGLVMGASTLTGVFLKLPAGALSDLFGRKRLLLAGSIVFASMPFGYLGVSTIGLLIALRFVHGSATAIFSPVAAASLSDLAPAGSRGTWLSLFSTAQGCGQAVGPVVAGYLLASGRFDLAFIVSGVIGLTVPLIVARWPGAATSAPEGRSMKHLTTGIAEVGRNRLVLVTSAAHAAQFVMNGMLSAFLPLYARDVLHFAGPQIGWLFALQTVTTLAVRPVIGSLSDRVGRRQVIVTGLTLSGLAVWALSLATGRPLVVAAIVSYAAGAAMTTAATGAYITDVTSRERYGAAHGVFGTIYDIGDAIGPLAGGLLVATLGYARMFQITASVALAAGVVFAIVTGRRVREAPSRTT